MLPFWCYCGEVCGVLSSHPTAMYSLPEPQQRQTIRVTRGRTPRHHKGKQGSVRVGLAEMYNASVWKELRSGVRIEFGLFASTR